MEAASEISNSGFLWVSNEPAQLPMVGGTRMFGMPSLGQEVRLNFWPVWPLKNLRLLLQELTPVNWSQIPAWVIPFYLPKIPHLFQTDAVFFTSSTKDCWVVLYVALSTCCVLPRGRLQHPGNDPLQRFGIFSYIWGAVLVCLFSVRTARHSPTEPWFAANSQQKLALRILSCGQISRVWATHSLWF